MNSNQKLIHWQNHIMRQLLISRITKKLPSIVLNNTIEIIECTEKSIIDLDSFPEWTKI